MLDEFQLHESTGVCSSQKRKTNKAGRPMFKDISRSNFTQVVMSHMWFGNDCTYPHAKLDVLPSVDFHARVKQSDFAKIFTVHHKGATNHGRGPETDTEKCLRHKGKIFLKNFFMNIYMHQY